MEDSTSRIDEINKRINYLNIEIVHKNYWPGGIVVRFREELVRLIDELEKLEKEND